jgi:hypothetical protein
MTTRATQRQVNWMTFLQAGGSGTGVARRDGHRGRRNGPGRAHRADLEQSPHHPPAIASLAATSRSRARASGHVAPVKRRDRALEEGAYTLTEIARLVFP